MLTLNGRPFATGQTTYTDIYPERAGKQAIYVQVILPIDAGMGVSAMVDTGAPYCIFETELVGVLGLSSDDGEEFSLLTANTSTTQGAHIRAKSQHIKTLPHPASPLPPHKPAPSEHQQVTSVHEKCVTCVHQSQPALPDDLRAVVETWDSLNEAVKAGILAMVQAARHTTHAVSCEDA